MSSYRVYFGTTYHSLSARNMAEAILTENGQKVNEEVRQEVEEKGGIQDANWGAWCLSADEEK